MALDERIPAAPALSPQSAISWGAIWAGAAVAIATSLVLTLAAAGLGFSLALPGLETRASLLAFTPLAGSYAIVVQVLSGALGGYLTGRLRNVWVEVHGDESHFRDTAHGLIAWAVATLGGVALAALVLAPYGQQMAGATSAGAIVVLTPDEALRAANIAAQASLFVAIGMLLSAFVAAVAARIGGQRSEEMHARRVV